MDFPATRVARFCRLKCSVRAVQPYPFRKSALRVLRDRSLANAPFVAWYASPFRIILVIERGAEITSPAALGSAVHKERHPRVGKRLSQAAGTKGRPKENPASAVVPAPFAKPVSSGAAGATLGSKRQGRSRSNLSDYALDNRSSTGGVGDRLLPQRVKRPLVPATGRQIPVRRRPDGALNTRTGALGCVNKSTHFGALDT